jgi:hypothetical protein
VTNRWISFIRKRDHCLEPLFARDGNARVTAQMAYAGSQKTKGHRGHRLILESGDSGSSMHPVGKRVWVTEFVSLEKSGCHRYIAREEGVAHPFIPEERRCGCPVHSEGKRIRVLRFILERGRRVCFIGSSPRAESHRFLPEGRGCASSYHPHREVDPRMQKIIY